MKTNGRCFIGRRWYWVICWLVFSILPHDSRADSKLFRIGFSTATISGVNENDAMAAIKVWSGAVARNGGIPMDPAPQLVSSVAAIRRALSTKEIDAITVNMDEFLQLRDELDEHAIFTSVNEGVVTEEYVVLVRSDSSFREITDLRGRRLVMVRNPRTSLATVWLDTVLNEKGLPPIGETFQVTQATKMSKAILEVFFKQTESCVVTRRSVKAMAELNPNIHRSLKELLLSPPVVPTVFCFRKDFDDAMRQKISTELVNVATTPAGQQVMTLFQSGPFELRPISCLETSLALLEKHEHLLRQTNLVGSAASSDAKAAAESRGAQP